MANYYKNANKFNVEVPTPTNGSLSMKPGEYVKGTYFAQASTNGTLTDVGAGVPAAVTANASLLIYTQDENAGVAVGTSIQTAEIDDLAVTTGKINTLAVTTAKINDLAVTTGKIAALAVDDTKLAALAVTAGKIAADAVVTAKIQNAAVTATKLAVFGTPTAAGDNGTQGMIKFDASYIYLCTAPDTWIRVAATPVAWA